MQARCTPCSVQVAYDEGSVAVVSKLEFSRVCASYDNGGVLAGPHTVSLQLKAPVLAHAGSVEADVEFGVRVEQGPKREIAVESGVPVYWSSLLKPLYELERLLMVFDGSFLPLKDLQYICPDDPALATEADCAIVRRQALSQRLNYFTPSKLAKCQKDLVDFWDVLTPEMCEQWRALLEELDIANQVYLYVLSENGMPIDLLLAFLVELAEPMIEIVNKERGLFPSLAPGEGRTTLKQCVNALINTYGRVIFQQEIESDYGGLLHKLVKSRVRIMHIKLHQGENTFFDGEQSWCYSSKVSLLYRVILLDLLGIPESSYAQRLESAVRALDDMMERAAGR